MLEVILVLVRHGEADHNVTESQRAGSGSGVIVNYVEDGEKRICDTELTQTGRQQAQLVAERMNLWASMALSSAARVMSVISWSSISSL